MPSAAWQFVLGQRNDGKLSLPVRPFGIGNWFGNDTDIRWKVLTIGSKLLSEVRLQIAEYLERLPSDCRDLLSASHCIDEPTFQPTIQLSYDEISSSDIDRLLNFAASANGAIGIDAAFLPFVLGTEPKTHVVLFSLAQLETHVAMEEPAIAELFRTIGSMDRFVAHRGDAMSAVEYLAAGTLECIHFCRANRQAMFIRW